MTKIQEHRSKINQQTDKMAPKQIRSSAKTKEPQTVKTPLVRRLKNIKNIKNAKMQEGSWTKLWTEIKEWDYVDKNPTPTANKIQHSTIVNYVNASLMDSFAGTKEIAVKFVISRYHNG